MCKKATVSRAPSMKLAIHDLEMALSNLRRINVIRPQDIEVVDAARKQAKEASKILKDLVEMMRM